jgi:Sulfotransferase domain
MTCSCGAILAAGTVVIVALNLSTFSRMLRQVVFTSSEFSGPRPILPHQNVMIFANTSVDERLHVENVTRQAARESKGMQSSNPSNTGPVRVVDEDNNDALDGPFPHVAWLMTFPNSGTTYTMNSIREYTNTTTATNYGHEQSHSQPSIPIHPDSVEGPFLRNLTLQKPSKYILTKTHCAGYSDQRRPVAESFKVGCRTGNRVVNAKTKVRTSYPADVPKRAVHLIRNPFDNAVARLHHRLKVWTRLHDDQLDVFNATRDGFRAYCAYCNRRDLKKNLAYYRTLDFQLLRRAAAQLPCHGEFTRYTFWHNSAAEVGEEMGIPVLTLFYEDYAVDSANNMKRLVEFLALSPAQGKQPLPFIPGKVYMDFYEEHEIELARTLVSSLASNESWALLSRYFPGATP